MTPELIQEATLQLEYSTKYNIWSNPKRPDDTQDYECEYCGRKCGKSPLYVHINTDGTCIPNWITETILESCGYQTHGCFPIGQSCAKKLFGKDIDLYTIKTL